MAGNLYFSWNFLHLNASLVNKFQFFQKMLRLYREVLVVGDMKAYSRSLSTGWQGISIFLGISHLNASLVSRSTIVLRVKICW